MEENLGQTIEERHLGELIKRGRKNPSRKESQRHQDSPDGNIDSNFDAAEEKISTRSS